MKRLSPLIVIFLSLFLFSPSLNNFFSADDWFHLSLVQINSLSEFLNFFKLTPTEQSASFYRPLSTQVFFWSFHSLFGLKHFFYHTFVLISFALSLYLIYKLALLLLPRKQQALVVLLIYSFSVTHFTRLYFLSAFQEILLTIFIVSALYNHIKNRSSQTTTYFILALLSKETAIVLPALLVLVDVYLKKLNYHKYTPYIVISLIYLYLRLVIFQGVSGDSYVWDFSFLKASNTLFWYTLWSFGAPEFLVDYVASGLKIVPKFFTDFRSLSYPIIASITLTISSFILIIILQFNKIKSNKSLPALMLGFLWFFITLLPVLFLPWHKFQLELTLPLIGFAIILSQFINLKNNLSKLFLILFLGLNLFSYYLTYPRHYSVGRAKIARNIYTYLKQNYPKPPVSSYFEFVNDTANYGSHWGSSKQIAYSLSYSDFFKVFYKNKTIKVYYQDFSKDQRPTNKTPLQLSSSQFLR